MAYSFLQPWSSFARGHGTSEMWNCETDPRVVLGADNNNGSDPAYHESSGDTMVPTYDSMKSYVNSTNHTKEGQNVLYADSHVSFEKSPYVGIDGDNIYTAMTADVVTPSQATTAQQEMRAKPRDQWSIATPNPGQWDTMLIPASKGLGATNGATP